MAESLPPPPSARRTVRSFCRLCSAQCGIRVDLQGETIMSVRGDREHPLSAGYTCPKGRTLPKVHHHPGRLDTPLLGRGSARRPASWEEAFDDLVPRLRQITDDHGPDSVGVFLGTGAALDGAGMLTARRFADALGTRSFYTTLTVDGPSRPYVGALMAGQPGMFAHAIDYARTTMTLLVGSNPVVSHGHTNAAPNPRTRLKSLTARGELWVVDTRRTETAALATRHLAPRPGTDHAWLAAMVRDALRRCDLEAMRTEVNGLDELIVVTEPYTMEDAAKICEIPLEDLIDLRDALVRHGRFSGVTGTGLTMARTANLSMWLMYALQIVTGSVDAPGGTWYNPGFIRSLDKKGPWRPGRHAPRPGPQSRPELPHQFGERPAVAIVDEIESGRMRALIGLGVHPVACLPEPERTAEALAALEVYVSADIVETSSTHAATHLLPCTDQLERADITFTAEQYLPEVAAQYTPAVVAPVAGRRDIWWMLAGIAERLGGCALPGARKVADTATDDLFADLMARGARADFATLRDAGVIVAEDAVFGWLRAGVAERGGWEIAPQELVAALAAEREADFAVRNARHEEFLLVPRRQLRHINSTLTDVSPAATVLLHPMDAAEAGIADGELVRVVNGRGSLELPAAVEDSLPRGVLSVPHGFEGANVNSLTSHWRGVDPLTGMPQYSAVSVRIEVVKPRDEA